MLLRMIWEREEAVNIEVRAWARDTVEQQKKDKIPAVIKWDKDGKEVYISGSFNNWEKKIRLVKR